VRSAAFIDTLPLALDHSSNTIYIEGQPVTDRSKLPLAIPYFASPKYFETMSIAPRDKAMGFLPSGHRGRNGKECSCMSAWRCRLRPSF